MLAANIVMSRPFVYMYSKRKNAVTTLTNASGTGPFTGVLGSFATEIWVYDH